MDAEGITFDFLSCNDGGFLDRHGRPYHAIVQLERSARRLSAARRHYKNNITPFLKAPNSDYFHYCPNFEVRELGS